MKRLKTMKYVGLSLLIVYLLAPVVMTIYLSLTHHLGLTFFGEYVPLTFWRGLMFLYMVILGYTGPYVLVVAIIYLIIYFYLCHKLNKED